MNQLTKEEYVWMQGLLCAMEAKQNKCELLADIVLANFKERFPESPPQHTRSNETCLEVDDINRTVTQKESKGVYVTREMLAKAWVKFGLDDSDLVFKHFYEELGLKP